ncbi:MAG: 50S ribosomal protein L11 methyltransferase [Methyloligellaceae bacterium]
MTPPIFKLTVAADQQLTQAMADILSELDAGGPTAVSWSEDRDGGWRLEAYFEGAPDLAILRPLLQSAVGPDAPPPSPTVEELPAQDWVAKVQRDLSPVEAGRFLVHGSHDRDRVHGSTAIEIDAGQAFGTAHHGTTRGCLLILDGLLKRHRFVRVLDIGTGSGVLAIAAAKVLRRPVLACDIDPVAVAIARDNAIGNGVGAFVRPVRAAGLDHPAIRRGGPYDLVLANILARPLAALATPIAAAARGGLVVLSGITRDQHAPLAARYRNAGFPLTRRLVLEEWVTLVLGRSG